MWTVFRTVGILVTMMCGAVKKSELKLNQLIPSDGMSDNLPPSSLIEATSTPAYKDVMRLNFGDYVHAHVPASITNTKNSRTTGAIAMYPLNNAQGGWYFMSLDTGKRIHRYQWETLSISKEVLNR